MKQHCNPLLCVSEVERISLNKQQCGLTMVVLLKINHREEREREIGLILKCKEG